jgi:hypothetical protein
MQTDNSLSGILISFRRGPWSISTARTGARWIKIRTAPPPFPGQFGQGKASGRTNNFERPANVAARSESATTANRCLIPSRVFPLRLEESDFLSDGASSGALPVINDDAANMACGGGRRFLPVPAGINPPCSFVALPPNVN